MQASRAKALTQVCALRFKYYAEPPTKVDVRLFFGPDVYDVQRQALMGDYNKGGKGWWNRAGAMLARGPQGVKEGVVFSTGEKHNQTNQPTDHEIVATPSPCCWWPCLIADDELPGWKIVRCWDQNLRHAQPWWTPSSRVCVFEDDASVAESDWTIVGDDTTVQIEEVFDHPQIEDLRMMD